MIEDLGHALLPLFAAPGRANRAEPCGIASIDTGGPRRSIFTEMKGDVLDFMPRAATAADGGTSPLLRPE